MCNQTNATQRVSKMASSMQNMHLKHVKKKHYKCSELHVSLKKEKKYTFLLAVECILKRTRVTLQIFFLSDVHSILKTLKHEQN